MPDCDWFELSLTNPDLVGEYLEVQGKSPNQTIAIDSKKIDLYRNFENVPRLETREPGE
jgi:hypothetical protein